MDFDIKVRYT